jgi:hypothetical protein
MPVRFDVATGGRNQLSAVFIELDRKTGLTKKMIPILINDDHPFYT